jgi:putative transposase
LSFYKNLNKIIDDYYHKAARRILERLKSKNVQRFFVSRNLGFAKQEESKLGKKFNKNFRRLPILRLLNNIKYLAFEYGIEIIEVDEAYTSKTSSISGDVKKAQELRQLKLDPSTVFNGKRGVSLQRENVKHKRRSFFFDESIQKWFHSDVNGAANHIIVGTQNLINFDKYKTILFKFANPTRFNLQFLINCKIA